MDELEKGIKPDFHAKPCDFHGASIRCYSHEASQNQCRIAQEAEREHYQKELNDLKRIVSVLQKENEDCVCWQDREEKDDEE